MLCTYRFLIYWEVRNTPEGRSWLEPVLPPGTSIGRRIGHSFSLIGKKRHPMGIIHNLLIIGNALIITGGSKLAGASQDPTRKGDVHTAKILRLVGQSIFLAVNVFLLFCIAKAVKKFKRENGGAVHPTLFVLLAIWPLLLVRGIYGVLAGVVPSFSYFTLSNYDEHGLKGSFVASEYILGTAPEWLSCILLLSTVATSRHDPEPQVVGMGPLKDKAEG